MAEDQRPSEAELSDEQLDMLAAVGETRDVAVGDVLFRAGEEGFAFIALIEVGQVITLTHDVDTTDLFTGMVSAPLVPPQPRRIIIMVGKLILQCDHLVAGLPIQPAQQ